MPLQGSMALLHSKILPSCSTMHPTTCATPITCVMRNDVNGQVLRAPNGQVLRAQNAHHLGVKVVYVPTVAADMPPCCFAFRDCQLHTSATHPTELIFCFLRFWWEWSFAGSANCCMCSNARRLDPRLSAMVGCDRIRRGLHSGNTPAKLTLCTKPAARGLDKRLQVRGQGLWQQLWTRCRSTRKREAPGMRAV